MSLVQPVLIVSHIPILAACLFLDGPRFSTENWTVPARWMHSDTVQLTNLFAQHPNVKAALSGHVHLLNRGAIIITSVISATEPSVVPGGSVSTTTRQQVTRLSICMTVVL
jgi:hypothetical protein